MTRVLVVHHDIDMADIETDELRSRGYEVEQCWGPQYHSCPVMRGETCAAAERADVLLYDVWSTGESDGGRSLVAGLRELHPDTPVVLTAPGMELDWVETEGAHKVIPLVGAPTTQRLVDAVEAAVASGIAERAPAPRRLTPTPTHRQRRPVFPSRLPCVTRAAGGWTWIETVSRRGLIATSAAWRTYDPDAIGDLFSVDATYRYHPEDEPVRGSRGHRRRLAQRRPTTRRSWRSRYEPFAVEGDRAVMRGSTEYVAADGETVERRFYNVWLCALRRRRSVPGLHRVLHGAAAPCGRRPDRRRRRRPSRRCPGCRPRAASSATPGPTTWISSDGSRSTSRSTVGGRRASARVQPAAWWPSTRWVTRRERRHVLQARGQVGRFVAHELGAEVRRELDVLAQVALPIEGQPRGLRGLDDDGGQ